MRVKGMMGLDLDEVGSELKFQLIQDLIPLAVIMWQISHAKSQDHLLLIGMIGAGIVAM